MEQGSLDNQYASEYSKYSKPQCKILSSGRNASRVTPSWHCVDLHRDRLVGTPKGSHDHADAHLAKADAQLAKKGLPPVEFVGTSEERDQLTAASRAAEGWAGMGDQLYANGKVFTGEGETHFASAFRITDGAFSWVGDSSDVAGETCTRIPPSCLR